MDSGKDQKSPFIDEVIGAYIKSVSNLGNHDKVLMIHVEEKGDTSILSIANTYPVLNKIKFNTVDTVLGYRIYFIGQNKNLFYSVNNKQIPKDLKEYQNATLDPTKPPIHRDPILWQFYYRKGELIEYYPKAIIDKYLKVPTHLNSAFN